MEISWRFREVFVEVSWLQIIAIEASSVFVVFSWDFRGPTKNEISGKIGKFSWPFRGRLWPSSNRKHAQAPCLGKHWKEQLS